MDEGIEKLEGTEVKISKIEVKDGRGDKADIIQEGEFKTKLESDKVGEKLSQFETFLGKYTKQKVSEGVEINLVYGRVGVGEVVDGKLQVSMPPNNEIMAASSDERSKPFLKVLTDVGITYKDYVLADASSTALHESEHMIIDSRPHSELDKDFETNTGIKNDESGHTLSLLDEGITYAFQMEKDSESELFRKLEGNKPQTEESYTIESRKKLGLALQPRIKEYLDGGKSVDDELLKFAGELMKNKDIVDIEKYVAEAERERLERRLSEVTEKILSEPIPLITDKEIVAPSGDKRDYVSVNHYVKWLAEDGKSYITRDGEINPLTEKYTDEKKLGKASGDIYITSLAAEYAKDPTKKEKYAQRAVETLKAWFVDEETRMTPSLEYAQMDPGDGEKSGNFYGIIEGVPLVRITEGVKILKENGLVDQETQKGIETWYNKYLIWLQTSEKGIGNVNAGNEKEKNGERGMPNNHGTFYDVQVAYIADFLGKSEIASKTLEGAKERIDNQILPTGEMPAETARKTESIDVSNDYQIFNLYAFSELAILGEKYGIDLWGHQKTEGEGGLQKAFEYFTGLLEKQEDKTKTFHFDRTGPLYLAFRAASKAYKNDGYWNLPKDYYANPLVDEVSREMFK
jgi:hypothetical protein